MPQSADGLAALGVPTATGRIAGYFARNPTARPTVRELQRTLGIASASAQRDLDRLARAGALRSVPDGRLKRYAPRLDSPIWAAVRLLIGLDVPEPPSGRVREDARRYGVDLGQLESMLRMTIEERITLLAGLVREEVDFVVVGGVSGAIHGSPFGTDDLDVCYDTAPANLARIARLLTNWKAYPREPESGLPFAPEVRALRTTPVMRLATTEGDLDLLDRIDGIGTYRDAVESSEEITAFALRFRVLTLDGLIRARRASARPKDLAQLPTLLALADLKLIA